MQHRVVPAKKKSGKGGSKWFPPPSEKGNYRLRKKFPEAVCVASQDALGMAGLFVRTDIRSWLVQNVGEGCFDYAVGENEVTFRFKELKHRNAFTGFLDALGD